MSGLLDHLRERAGVDHRHASDGSSVTYRQGDLLEGSSEVREVARCLLCGAWFRLDRDGAGQGGLFDNEVVSDG